jgi:hypothetical protein
MDRAIVQIVEYLEAKIGPEGVLQVLQDGLSGYGERLDKVCRSIRDPGGEIARRVMAIVGEKDPKGALVFEIAGDGGTIAIRGNFDPEVMSELNAEFARLADLNQGLRRLYPQIRKDTPPGPPRPGG